MKAKEWLHHLILIPALILNTILWVRAEGFLNVYTVIALVIMYVSWSFALDEKKVQRSKK